MKNIKVKVSIKEDNLEWINSKKVSLQYFVNKAIEDAKNSIKDKPLEKADFIVKIN